MYITKEKQKKKRERNKLIDTEYKLVVTVGRGKVGGAR